MKFTYNDGGREAAGFKGQCGDCVTRAIAIATGRSYALVYAELAKVNTQRRTRGQRTARNGIVVNGAAFKSYMRGLGWTWTPTMGIGTGCKVHLRDSELPPGRLIVSVSKHYTSVVDGVIYDTYDPQRDGTRCVYGYWREGL